MLPSPMNSTHVNSGSKTGQGRGCRNHAGGPRKSCSLKLSFSIELMILKMLLIQFVPIVKAIQMRLMKVGNKMKNILNQEIQYDLESRLIKVVIQKMPSMQFV
jgi:hypothetical protein